MLFFVSVSVKSYCGVALSDLYDGFVRLINEYN